MTSSPRGEKQAAPRDLAAPFREVRRAHATEIAEDYVEAIAEIVERSGECRVKDLSVQFGVSHVTVTKTVSRLVEEGLVQTEPYRPLKLTNRGKKLAIECQRRHEIVLRFLQFLGVSAPTARIDAEGLEHHISPETLERLEEFLSKYNIQ